MFGWWPKALPPEVVVVDNVGVERRLCDGSLETIAWKDLVQVTIVTTEEGPFTEDLFFLLEGANGEGCLVPSCSSQSTPLLRYLQKLPGFDNGKLSDAIGCVENARFVCWKKPA
jgi:hypothetical protein